MDNQMNAKMMEYPPDVGPNFVKRCRTSRPSHGLVMSLTTANKAQLKGLTRILTVICVKFLLFNKYLD